MLTEIGSNFWYNYDEFNKENHDYSPFEYGYKGSDYLWLSSGRTAISYAIKTAIERNPDLNKLALLPPYTCHTVFNPFYNAGFEVETYDIDNKFITTKQDILNACDKYKPGIVLFQRYFGFESLKEGIDTVKELRNRGIICIEDCTQSLFGDFEDLDVDYYVGSIRKFFGTPDGGFVICREGKLLKTDLNSSNNTYLDTMRNGVNLKYQYMNYRLGEKKNFLDLFRTGEEILDEDNNLRNISKVALNIQYSLDKKELIDKRRNNYQYLSNSLKDCKGIRIIFDELKDNEVPLYMPVYVYEDRLKLQAYLRDASIYAPIVWPRPERIPNDICDVADDFYNHIICLPIDQRYDVDDMERFSLRIKMFYKENDIPDIFYLDSWRELYSVQEESTESDCFVYKHEDGTIIYPFIKRETPSLDDGKKYYDTITPRGFNGPMIINENTDNHERLLKDFEKDFTDYCLKEGIVTEYVRFCPWVRNDEYFKDYYSLRYNHETVAIDLTVNDILMDEISSKRRNQIRMGIKRGTTVEFDFEGKTVETFYNLYQNTIKKNDIGSYYDFDLDFLKKHFEMLKGKCWIANAINNGRIISSSFVLMQGENMHYHLSANDYSCPELQGNSVLLYEIAKLGKAYGCKYLHLGGIGVGKESLMSFKLSFTKNGVFPFYVGSRIRNQEVYDKLCDKYAKDGSKYFPPYRE